jgi:hypothetical protein
MFCACEDFDFKLITSSFSFVCTCCILQLNLDLILDFFVLFENMHYAM